MADLNPFPRILHNLHHARTRRCVPIRKLGNFRRRKSTPGSYSPDTSAKIDLEVYVTVSATSSYVIGHKPCGGAGACSIAPKLSVTSLQLNTQIIK